MSKIVEINCLEHIYADKTKVELCGIEFVVNQGEKVAILGPNGGGKTTLIRHILGVLSPSHGEIKVFGIDPAREFNKIRHKIGVVLQNVEEQLIGPTVIDDIIFSPLNYGYSKHQSIEMAVTIMDHLGISHLQDRIIHYLSGGEKRKVALAGALVLNPELLVLDEPFSGLDLKSQRELICLINKVSQEKNISVVISTHDVELVAEFADTMYLLSSKKKISRKGSPQEILNLKNELENYNLDEPAVVKLFNILKDKGFDLGSPINVDEAAGILADNLK